MTYQIDPAHSAAQFKLRHMMIANVKGEFDRLSGTVDFDPADPSAARVDVTIEVSSISTRDSRRDQDLQSPRFLDAANHPSVTFQSKRVEPAGDRAYKVIGDLSLRGVTKEVTLDVHAVSDEVKDPWGNMRRGAEATTRIHQSDFGLSFNAPLEGGGFMLSDAIDITLDMEMTRRP